MLESTMANTVETAGEIAERYARECGQLSALITAALIALRHDNTDDAMSKLEEAYRVSHNGESYQPGTLEHGAVNQGDRR